MALFKFVNFNKLAHNQTLSSLGISSRTVFIKLHRKMRGDKQVIQASET